MLLVTLKILVMFILTVGIMRLMGKSSIVQLTPYDLVAIIIVGTIIAEPLISAEFWPAILRSGIIVLFYLLFAKLSLNQLMNKFLLGEPSILIKHGKIVEDVLEKEHISLIQLLSILRTAGYSKITEINYAILEPTGTISVIPISSARPVTLADLDIQGQYEGLPLALIIDGQIQKKNLKLISKDEVWLLQKVKAEGVHDIKQVIYGFVDDQSHKIYLNLRDQPQKTGSDEEQSKPRENNQAGDDTIKNLDQKFAKQIDFDKPTEQERCIYLIKDQKIQTHGLQQVHLSKSELLDLLGVDNIDNIQEVSVQQKIRIKRNTK